jgi:hypothetical protein
MTQIDVVPLVLKGVILTLGTDTYERHVDQVTFTPSASSITWTGLDNNSYTDVATATWACGLNYAQDWDTPDSLSQFLYENEGETVSATFSPRSGSGPAFTADLVITPGAIGGTVNAYATASVSLGSTRPVLVPGTTTTTTTAAGTTTTTTTV